MGMTLNVSKETEEALRNAWGGDLEQVAVEALILEGYRSGRFGEGTVRRLLGFETRIQAEQWLGEKGVYRNYGIDDLRADLDRLEALLGDRTQ